MFDLTSLTRSLRRPLALRIDTLLRRAGLVALLLVGLAAPPVAAADNPSGLPLPRFVTTRSNPINVRVGPGTKYDIAWVYVKAGMPVEIIQEFDTWRKIRDVDGSEGWLHQNLLKGERAGLVAPWRAEGEQIALRRDRKDDAPVRAWLTPKFRVELKECDGIWCQVVATSHPVGAASQNFEGYMLQSELWGVYKDEVFD
ncbi:MAG: SH3 domain-containing protein [Devosia sp.]|nr:SH3 domain-containing protein [Devosia sp.]